VVLFCSLMGFFFRPPFPPFGGSTQGVCKSIPTLICQGFAVGNPPVLSLDGTSFFKVGLTQKVLEVTSFGWRAHLHGFLPSGLGNGVTASFLRFPLEGVHFFPKAFQVVDKRRGRLSQRCVHAQERSKKSAVREGSPFRGRDLGPGGPNNPPDPVKGGSVCEPPSLPIWVPLTFREGFSQKTPPRSFYKKSVSIFGGR